jgi:hypothetical protein
MFRRGPLRALSVQHLPPHRYATQAPRGSPLDSPGLFLAEALREHPTLLRASNVLHLCASYGAPGIAAAESAASVTLAEATDDALSILFTNASANGSWLASAPHVALLEPGAAGAAEAAAAAARAFGPFDAVIVDAVSSPKAAEDIAELALAALATPPVFGGGGGGSDAPAPREVRMLVAHRVKLDADGEDEALATLLVNLPTGAFLDAALIQKLGDAAFCVTSSPKQVDYARISSPKLGAAAAGGDSLAAGMPDLALGGGGGGVPAPPATPGHASVLVAKHVRVEPLPPVSEDLSNICNNPELADKVVLITARFMV